MKPFDLKAFTLDDLNLTAEARQWARDQITSRKYASETELVIAALTLMEETIQRSKDSPVLGPLSNTGDG